MTRATDSSPYTIPALPCYDLDIGPAVAPGAKSSLLASEAMPPSPVVSRAAVQRRRLGGFLVLVVSMLYVGSGVAIQLLFDEMNFEKPFFFSYVSVSLCSSYLLQFGYLRCRRSCVRSTHAYSQELQYELQYVQQVSIAHQPMRLVRPALLLAPAYFCLNYTYFLSLDLTTVSETMILSSSTGVWTLIFSTIFLSERMTRIKVATVLVSILGMCLVSYGNGSHGGHEASTHVATSVSDSSSNSPASSTPPVTISTALAGDLLAVMSAASSGVYMVLLRVCVPDEEAVHMPSLFGMMGFVSMFCFLPLFPMLHFTGVETFGLLPSSNAVWTMLLSAATSTVLPDMLLAKAVVMTSPLVATLGLSTMIPLSVMCDYVRGLAHLSPQFFLGTIAVFLGFQMEALSDHWESEKREPNEST